MKGNSYRRAIWLGESVTDEKTGVTLYPVKMDQWEEWTKCKRSILLRQSTLPPQYAVMPYLTALFAFDAQYGFTVGLARDLVQLLSMVTLLPEEKVYPLVKADDQSTLTAIALEYTDDDVKRIEPRNFGRIRSVIAEMNGDELPDESEDPDLVQSEMDIAEMNSMDLDIDFETMLDSVGYNARREKAELLGMTVREFTRLRKAISRDKRFALYGSAEMSGMVKFKNGNPQPDWCFDRVKHSGTSMEKLSAFQQRMGATGNL